ncbi:hypothetical protein ACFWPK_19005 [Nocardia sp. NPDC058519]|uniref:hypothetical protein n=1 Tax=Nocardia sp. NPDC058519 TaxID=3346535 RepID=UPI0036503AE5
MRTAAAVFTSVAVLVEVAWLAFGDATIGPVTIGVVSLVAVTAVTLGRVRALVVVTRVALGVLFAGSVADRFGMFGAPGSAGVSWGSYAEFVDYTRTLLPAFAADAAPIAAGVATVAEAVLGTALIFAVRPRLTAAAAAALFTMFAVAMVTSVGFAETADYAVPVMIGGALLVSAAAVPASQSRRFGFGRREIA